MLFLLLKSSPLVCETSIKKAHTTNLLSRGDFLKMEQNKSPLERGKMRSIKGCVLLGFVKNSQKDSYQFLIFLVLFLRVRLRIKIKRKKQWFINVELLNIYKHRRTIHFMNLFPHCRTTRISLFLYLKIKKIIF